MRSPRRRHAAAWGMREMKELKRAEAEQRKAAAKAKRDKEKRVTDLEMQIAALEGRQKDLTAELEDPPPTTRAAVRWR